MSGPTVSWNVPPSVIGRGLESEIRAGLRAAGPEITRALQEYARASHRWQNQTGAAESNLVASFAVMGDALVITLVSGAPHGIWLEVRWGGKYAVIPLAIYATRPLAIEVVTRHILRAIG